MKHETEGWHERNVEDLFAPQVHGHRRTGPTPHTSAFRASLPDSSYEVRVFGRIYTDIEAEGFAAVWRAGALGASEVREHEDDEWVKLLRHPDFGDVRDVVMNQVRDALETPRFKAARGPKDTGELPAVELERLVEDSQVEAIDESEFEASDSETIAMEQGEDSDPEGLEEEEELLVVPFDSSEIEAGLPAFAQNRLASPPPVPVQTPETPELPVLGPTPQSDLENGFAPKHSVRPCGQTSRPAAPIRATMTGVEAVPVGNYVFDSGPVRTAPKSLAEDPERSLSLGMIVGASVAVIAFSIAILLVAFIT